MHRYVRSIIPEVKDMVQLLMCSRCKLVIAVGGPVKKTTCPRCQSPATAQPGMKVEFKCQGSEVAA